MNKISNDYFFTRRSTANRSQPRSEPDEVDTVALYGKVRSYRGIPDPVDDKLRALATEMKVPLGELVRAFLEYAIAAHNDGELMLNPLPRVVRSHRTNTLYPLR